MTHCPFPAQARRLFALEQAGAGPFLLALDTLTEGPIDVHRLAASVQAIGRRHEALRTAVMHTDAGPMQRVLPDAPLPSVLDLGGCDEDAFAAAIEAEGAAQVASLVGEPNAPLFRARVLRRDARVAAVIATAHHAIVDGWSLQVLAGDLFRHYFGQPPGPPPLQYGEVARREAAYLSSARAQIAFEFWRESLSCPAVSAWPDGPRHESGASFHFIPAECVAAAEAIARKAGTGLLAALLAAAGTSLLPRLGPHLRIGVPVANRSGAAEKGAVGLLSHSLPVRLDLSGDRRGIEIVRTCGAALHAAFRRRGIPAAALVERFRQAEYRVPHELAPAQVNLFPWAEAPLPGLRFTPLLQRPVATGALDGLNLFAARRADGILLSVGHGGSATARDAAMFAERFTAALMGLVAEPEAVFPP